ncbi:hypothetical protein LSH36_677g04014 [Paralvinella palmiformis]|uniref:Uncharacterized protein n=1 Tax=Paralvinella palmiformis TaxID=53620 RepID=A0AAD9J2Q7_9ANNE|nr:hypothetical protein LSH36_677g04014 [Paralvinella palmiformis]
MWFDLEIRQRLILTFVWLVILLHGLLTGLGIIPIIIEYHLGKRTDGHEYVPETTLRIRRKPYPEGSPLLTMFTTLKDRKCRDQIHNSTMTNWATLMPAMLPVLYVPRVEWNASRWKNRARDLGWRVRKAEKLKRKIPILNDMFRQTLRQSKTPFVGFANADILFDETIIQTLQYLIRVIDVDNWTILITGKRRNINITQSDVGSGGNLTRISFLARETDFFHGKAQDYFIISRRGLPWEEIPDFVIGRNGYDNWLLVMAQKWNAIAIDGSLTIGALHQSGVDGFQSGFTTNDNDTIGLNWDLVMGFNYHRGRTECLPYYTRYRCTDHQDITESWKKRNDIVLLQRPLYPHPDERYQGLGPKC